MLADTNLHEHCGICESGKNTVADQVIEPIDGRIAGRPGHRYGVIPTDESVDSKGLGIAP
jgi:hypothetical protein